MASMDRSVLYERWLDDLDLYLSRKHDLAEKLKKAYESGDYVLGEARDMYWQEEDELESLREISRRALDEYIRGEDST